MNLRELLPRLVPEATSWANAEARRVVKIGRPLTEAGLALAHQVGVRQPELVRLLYVDQLPIPVEQLLLRQVILETGLLGPGMAGLTLGHSILIIHGEGNSRLVSHELRHVHQYETLGGIDGFLPIYLDEIARVGYENARLEVDARAHEVTGPNQAWV